MDPLRLVVATVVWNHRDRLPLLLRSLEGQSRKPDHVVLVDAASQDGVSGWLANSHPHIAALRLFQHHGLSHAWRQAAKFALQRIPAEDLPNAWILFVSPETLLADDACERLLTAALHHDDAGALGPALLRAWYEGEGEDGLDRVEPTELIESLGFIPRKSFAWQHLGQGGSLGVFDPRPTEVFVLPTGAAAVRADLLSRLLDLGAFSLPWRTVDALFLDLGWRLRWLGARALVLPEARAWRIERKGDGTGVASWRDRIDRERDRRQLVRVHLFGIGARLRTLPWRIGATLRGWPGRLWGWLTRRLPGDPRPSFNTQAAFKVARSARTSHQKEAAAVLRDGVLHPLTRRPPGAGKD